MEVSAQILSIGLVLTGLGVILLLLSLRRRHESDSMGFRSTGVIFFGPIPIILGGKNKWAIIGIAIFVVVIIYFTSTVALPAFG